MAIGLAKMVGINLPINFLSPFKSANIAEFWRRWHITHQVGDRISIYTTFHCSDAKIFQKKNLCKFFLSVGLYIYLHLVTFTILGL